MERDPTQFSRPLVVFGLGVVLLGDITLGLPDTAFVGAGVAVLFVAGTVHYVGDEPRAAAGWGMFALALGFFGLVDVESGPLGILAVVSLLFAGLALQISERVEERL